MLLTMDESKNAGVTMGEDRQTDAEPVVDGVRLDAEVLRPDEGVVDQALEQRMRDLVARETKALTDALAARGAELDARELAARTRRASGMRALKITASVAALASTLWITKNVVAQAC